MEVVAAEARAGDLERVDSLDIDKRRTVVSQKMLRTRATLQQRRQAGMAGSVRLLLQNERLH